MTILLHDELLSTVFALRQAQGERTKNKPSSYATYTVRTELVTVGNPCGIEVRCEERSGL